MGEARGGCQKCSGKYPSPLISTPPFLFCLVNHHPPPAKEVPTGVEQEMVLSQIALALKLLDAYPRGTASNCLGCLGVRASLNLRTCTTDGLPSCTFTEELVHSSSI